KFAEFCLNRNDNQYTTSMYCKAQVNSELIILILDSGSSGCVVSAGFLKKAGIQIDQPSTVMIVGVHREQKRLIGEIDRFLITVDGKTITSRAVVTEAGYGVLAQTRMENKTYTSLVEYLSSLKVPKAYLAKQDLEQPLRVIKKDQIDLILQAMHEHLVAGHFGERTTVKKIQRKYHWNQMMTNVKNFVRMETYSVENLEEEKLQSLIVAQTLKLIDDLFEARIKAQENIRKTQLYQKWHHDQQYPLQTY
ncbi:4391_t:CDS:2, partial [Gigaspora margarita]